MGRSAKSSSPPRKSYYRSLRDRVCEVRLRNVPELEGCVSIVKVVSIDAEKKIATVRFTRKYSTHLAFACYENAKQNVELEKGIWKMRFSVSLESVQISKNPSRLDQPLHKGDAVQVAWGEGPGDIISWWDAKIAKDQDQENSVHVIFDNQVEGFKNAGKVPICAVRRNEKITN